MNKLWKFSLLPLFGMILLAFPLAHASTISSYETGSGGGTPSSSHYSVSASSIGNIDGTSRSSHYSMTAGWIPGVVAGNGFDIAGSNLGNSIITYINGVVSTITIPNTVVNPTINFDNILVQGASANTVAISQDLTITSGLADYSVQIFIPAGTVISGPTTWNGVIKLPVELPISAVTVPNSLTNEVIFVGLDADSLTFSQPVRVTFFDQTTKLAGFLDSTNTLNLVPTICNGDDLATVSAQLTPGQACKINNSNGVDLDIWTTHFTDIFTYHKRSSGGQASDIIPPTFGGSMFSPTEFPLTIDNNTFVLPKMTNTITPTTITAGIPTHIKLLLYEDSGPSSVAHVGMYLHLTNQQDLINSDTYIIWEPKQAPIVHDPNGFFSDVKVTSATAGDKLEIDYSITFTKKMLGPAMIIRAWDATTNSFDTHILDALNVIGPSTATSQNSVPSQSQSLITTPQTNTPTQTPTQSPSLVASSNILNAIQDWGGYSPHPISDSEFLKDVNINGNHVPSWVAKTTKWVVDGTLSQDDFINMLKYLSNSGIIK